MKLWVVWYGKAYAGTDVEARLRESSTDKWRCYGFASDIPNDVRMPRVAKVFASGLLRDGMAASVNVVEAETRYKALKAVQAEQPKMLYRDNPQGLERRGAWKSAYGYLE